MGWIKEGEAKGEWIPEWEEKGTKFYLDKAVTSYLGKVRQQETSFDVSVGFEALNLKTYTWEYLPQMPIGVDVGFEGLDLRSIVITEEEFDALDFIVGMEGVTLKLLVNSTEQNELLNMAVSMEALVLKQIVIVTNQSEVSVTFGANFENIKITYNVKESQIQLDTISGLLVGFEGVNLI